MTLRGEYFSDPDAVTSPFVDTDGGHVYSTTLSGNIRVNNLVIIPEVRMDLASSKIFKKPSGNSVGAPNSLIGAYYKF